MLKILKDVQFFYKKNRQHIKFVASPICSSGDLSVCAKQNV